MEVYLYNSLLDESPAVYVGSTTQPKQRFQKYEAMHFKMQRYFYSWAKKHGLNNMQLIRIPVNAESDKELRMWEGFYIKLFGSYVKDTEIGLNLILNPTENVSKDETVKEKKRIRFSGERNPMYGKKQSQGAKEKTGKRIIAYKVRIEGKQGRHKYFVHIDSDPIVFYSIRDCCSTLGVERRAVQRILSGVGQTSKGYTFKDN